VTESNSNILKFVQGFHKIKVAIKLHYKRFSIKSQARNSKLYDSYLNVALTVMTVSADNLVSKSILLIVKGNTFL
jgi:hypothetical protein